MDNQAGACMRFAFAGERDDQTCHGLQTEMRVTRVRVLRGGGGGACKQRDLR